MATQNVNLQISIEQIIDLILQLPEKEQENIIQKITKQKENKYNEFFEKINGFSLLDQNWDSYQADKISEKAIQKTISILEILVKITQQRSIKLHVFPMRNGGIQFELDKENLFLSLEIEIDTNGILKLIHFDEEGEIIKEINNFEIEKLNTII